MCSSRWSNDSGCGFPRLQPERPSHSAHSAGLVANTGAGPPCQVFRSVDVEYQMPVPVEMNRWIRSSSGCTTKRPLGPIMRISWPSSMRHSSVVNRLIGTRRT